MSRIKLAVIFGGLSNEHEISLISATYIINNLDCNKYDVLKIGISKKGKWLFYPGDTKSIADGSWEDNLDNTPCILSPDPMHEGFIKILSDGTVQFMRVDCIFPVLHGKNGEDGTIQGLFTLSKIPYVGCDVISSANCMDKDVTHTLLEYANIKTAKWVKILRHELSNIDSKCDEIAQTLNFPLFVKPSNCGSSVGISKVSHIKELKTAIKHAFTHDSKVIVEEGINGREIECAVIGNSIAFSSTVGEIKPANDFYDFDAKYNSSESVSCIPADISEDDSKRIREIAERAYLALGCKGLSRVDFFLCENGDIYLNEINTLPGFTPISMFHKMMDNDGINVKDLLDRLVALAFERADVTYE